MAVTQQLRLQIKQIATAVAVVFIQSMNKLVSYYGNLKFSPCVIINEKKTAVFRHQI